MYDLGGADSNMIYFSTTTMPEKCAVLKVAVMLFVKVVLTKYLPEIQNVLSAENRLELVI